MWFTLGGLSTDTAWLPKPRLGSAPRDENRQTVTTLLGRGRKGCPLRFLRSILCLQAPAGSVQEMHQSPRVFSCSADCSSEALGTTDLGPSCSRYSSLVALPPSFFASGRGVAIDDFARIERIGAFGVREHPFSTSR